MPPSSSTSAHGPGRAAEPQAVWRPDPVLGAGYERTDLPLGADAEGELLAVLVHRAGRPPRGRPMLVLHGWSDYVFQRDLLEHLAERGLDVWALDLRKHGRSLLPGQTPTAVSSLEDYDAELGAALAFIADSAPAGSGPPLLLAHSTGGLVAALWAMRRPDTVAGLVLNSPWLAFHLGDTARRAVLPLVRGLARRRPAARILPRGTDHYARTTHRERGGAFEYDLALKPPGGHPFPASTMAAVLEGQGRLAAGEVGVPVLVLRSDRSRLRPRFDESMRRADVVLDVRAMDAAARRLGPDVEIAVIEGAVHDVFLSEPGPRAAATAALDDWLARDRRARDRFARRT
ncbi:alpha/beta hydrolase [Brachybacterium huguangmaarense]